MIAASCALGSGSSIRSKFCAVSDPSSKASVLDFLQLGSSISCRGFVQSFFFVVDWSAVVPCVGARCDLGGIHVSALVILASDTSWKFIVFEKFRKNRFMLCQCSGFHAFGQLVVSSFQCTRIGIVLASMVGSMYDVYLQSASVVDFLQPGQFHIRAQLSYELDQELSVHLHSSTSSGSIFKMSDHRGPSSNLPVQCPFAILCVLVLLRSCVGFCPMWAVRSINSVCHSFLAVWQFVVRAQFC